VKQNLVNVEKALVLKIAKKAERAVASLGLRFDRSVIRLADDLHSFAGKAVPAGTTVLVSLAAPIRSRAKTASALKTKIESLLERKHRRRDRTATINGNPVRIRLLKPMSPKAPRMLVFVHNRSSSSQALLNLIEEYLLS